MKIINEEIFLFNSNKVIYINGSPLSQYFIKFINISKQTKIFLILILSLLLLSLPFLSFDIAFNRYYLNKTIYKKFIPNTYRIAFVFGTRPEAIKLFPLIKKLIP